MFRPGLLTCVMFYQTMMAVFSSVAFQSPAGIRDTTPIFIVGLPRSGSTLIEQLLATHSQVFALGEDTPLAPVVGELMRRLQDPSSDQYQVSRGHIILESFVLHMCGFYWECC